MMNLNPTTPPPKLPYTETVVPIAQPKARQIQSAGLPFSPTIASGSVKTSIPKPSSTALKSQENCSKNSQKMTDDAVKHSSTMELDRDFICEDQTYLDSHEVIEDLQNRLKDFDVPASMRGEKGQKSDGHNQALLENSIKVLRKSAQSLVDRGEAKDLKTAYKKLVGVLDKYDDLAL